MYPAYIALLSAAFVIGIFASTLACQMPTGVAVTAAMNHGGPFPATGHPGFTAVGLPASIQRFAVLHCYDNVRPARLPAALKG